MNREGGKLDEAAHSHITTIARIGRLARPLLTRSIVADVKFPILKPRSLFRRETVKDDAVAGLVLGVESIPDGLASGLLAGVNPVAGLYGYLYGMIGGALFTSTAFMTIQATGAMSIIVADVDLGSREDPARSLFTLSMLTGIVMIVAGLLRLGSFLRFVSNSVMTGFVTAVGINIVLGQLNDFSGYQASGANRVLRAIDLLVHLNRADPATVVVGTITIVLIVVLGRTRLGALGMVVAVFAGSAAAAVFRAFDREIVLVRDIADVPRSLPFIQLPIISEVPFLLVPAVSLAFVGLVQGAAVSAGFPNDDGSLPSNSQDFVGQGAGNIMAGLFQGTPVGGSMSASAIVTDAGAKSRTALFIAGLVMAVVIIGFGWLVELIAIPAVAGLLIVVGVGTVKPAKVLTVARTGKVPLTVMSITLVLTMIIPLQFAVLVGVGLSVLLFVISQSSRLVTFRLEMREDGRTREVEPPAELPPGEVVVLQPYGAIFFATASVLLEQMPTVVPTSRHSVVILRIRGSDDAGATFLDILGQYAKSLRNSDCKLMLVTNNQHVIDQIHKTTAIEAIGIENTYHGTEYVGETVRRAYVDALAWVADRTAEVSKVAPTAPAAPASRRDDLPSDQLGL
jgi:SulP family sulfate permease